MINVDVKLATEQIVSTLKSVSNQNVQVATMRAINHTLAKAQSQASREVRSVYNMAVKDVNAGLTLIHATSSNQTGKIMASMRPMPLVKFNPVELIGDIQTKWTGSKKNGGFSSKKVKKGIIGVTVEILKGQPKTIKSAFLVYGGKGAVKAPGQYGSQGFEFRDSNEKGPQMRLNTKSVFWAVMNQAVEHKLEEKIKVDYPTRLKYELEKGIKYSR